LDDALGDRHHRIDANAWTDIYVVGDVHGCYDRLMALRDRLDPAPEDLIVLVGDLVRKGPDSAAVVDHVRTHDNVVTVRGNNEAKLLGGRRDAGLDDGQRAWLDALPVAVSFDDALVVHAGIDPRRPLTEQTIQDLTTVRSFSGGYDPPFWFDRHAAPPRIFFGHTVLAEPLVTADAVGLDTGCVYGGRLSAYDWRGDRIVSVPGREHVSRSDDAVLDPRVAEA